MIVNKHMPKNTETIFTSPSRFAVEKKNKQKINIAKATAKRYQLTRKRNDIGQMGSMY